MTAFGVPACLPGILPRVTSAASLYAIVDADPFTATNQGECAEGDSVGP
jgi:hypothetical protein